MYTHIDDHHPDTKRFVANVENWIGKGILVEQSPLESVDNACRMARFIKNRNGGAACTRRLKRDVNKKFECDHIGMLRIVWGFDCTEKTRMQRVQQSMPNHEHIFPLAENNMTKQDAHQALAAAGIKRPAMYDLGYHNNNCIGCIKGGMGYWNKIRIDFPDVFSARSRLERDIGFAILGRNIWLDELDPHRGRHAGPICGDCGLLCETLQIN